MGAAARVVVHVPEPTASGLVARIDAHRQAGDNKTALALLREVVALRDRLGRLEAGVRVAMEATR